MAVAKYKLEIDRRIREAGGKVVRGRIYNGRGEFWGTRSEFMDMEAIFGERMQETCLEAFRKQADECARPDAPS